MPDNLESGLARWQAAGLLDAAMAERIRRFEEARAGAGSTRLRWPALLALGAGGLMLGAGVLLLVAAHWDGLAPGWQFTLVLLLVAAFHAAGAVASDRFEALATTFHALGTGALGAGIFLAGQIFNLQSDWPRGILLWAVGAALGWWLRRDWPQAAFLAVLLPAWLVGEWLDATQLFSFDQARTALAGVALLAFAYLWAEAPGVRTSARRVLTALGAAAVLPLAVAVAIAGRENPYHTGGVAPRWVDVAGALLFLALPLGLGWALRRRQAWPLLLAALWIRLGLEMPRQPEALPYLWGAVGAVGLTAGGVLDQSRTRINLGVIGFGLTVLTFYFSSVMDKLGRSASLIVGGTLFLLGGWLLERLRRRLVLGTTGPAAP